MKSIWENISLRNNVKVVTTFITDSFIHLSHLFWNNPSNSSVFCFILSSPGAVSSFKAHNRQNWFIQGRPSSISKGIFSLEVKTSTLKLLVFYSPPPPSRPSLSSSGSLRAADFVKSSVRKLPITPGSAAQFRFCAALFFPFFSDLIR